MKSICLILLMLFSQTSYAGNSPNKSDLVIYWLANNNPSEGVNLGFIMMNEVFEIDLKGCEQWLIQKNSFVCINDGFSREIATLSVQVEEAGGDLSYPALYREVRLHPKVKASLKAHKEGRYIRSWTLEVSQD